LEGFTPQRRPEDAKISVKPIQQGNFEIKPHQ